MKKVIRISIALLFIILLISVGYAFYVYHSIEKTVSKMQIPSEETNQTALEERDVHTFLLLGIGDRPKIGDAGRANSIIVVSVNPKTNRVFMFNIPRDSRVEIVGKNKMDKINHSFAYGGTEMAKKTVEKFLDQPIDYVVQTNMEGLTQLVDAFGGIEVNNAFAFDQKDQYSVKNHHYEKGLIQLDGERALHYSRMRKSDPKGDLGRNQRQRQVVTALLNKMASFSSILKLEEVLNIMGNNVKTNVTFDDMKKLFSQLQQDWNKYEITTDEISGSSEMEGGIYYYIVPDAERERISAAFKENASAESDSNEAD